MNGKGLAKAQDNSRGCGEAWSVESTPPLAFKRPQTPPSRADCSLHETEKEGEAKARRRYAASSLGSSAGRRDEGHEAPAHTREERAHRFPANGAPQHLAPETFLMPLGP